MISEGAGGDMVSEYKTVVYYHDDKPKWCETVKVGDQWMYLWASNMLMGKTMCLSAVSSNMLMGRTMCLSAVSSNFLGADE